MKKAIKNARKPKAKSVNKRKLPFSKMEGQKKRRRRKPKSRNKSVVNPPKQELGGIIFGASILSIPLGLMACFLYFFIFPKGDPFSKLLFIGLLGFVILFFLLYTLDGIFPDLTNGQNETLPTQSIHMPYYSSSNSYNSRSNEIPGGWTSPQYHGGGSVVV